MSFKNFTGLTNLLVVVTLTLTAVTCHAIPSLESTLINQRYHYQKAKTALIQSNMKEYRAHLAQLGDYPLKQYLEFGELRTRITDAKQEEIDRFLTQYPESYLGNRVRLSFMGILANRQKWPEFKQYYQTSDNKSIDTYCHWLNARLQTGDLTAYSEILTLWQQGKSQPKSCDAPFAQWRKAGQLTQDLVWTRLNNALELGEIALARHLASLLTTYKPQGALYLQVAANPRLIIQRQKFNKKDWQTQQVIGYGIRRLAKTKPLEALQHWELYEAQQIFADDVMAETKLAIATALIRSGNLPQAQDLLGQSRLLHREDVIDQLLREVLATNDWKRLADGLAMLSEESRKNERWAYWAARTQDVLKKPIPGFGDSTSIYREVAKNRSFYGFLASDKLGQNYSLVDQSAQVDKTLFDIAARLPVMRRIQELRITGNEPEARAEWYYTSKVMEPQRLAAAAQVIQNWGWYNSGIQAMVNGNLWNELTVRFPLAYQHEITKVATAQRIEPTFVYAIARQESAFDAQARSPVGALGLMQIMPQTAVYTAKLSGIKHTQKEELFKVEHNMRLGTHYLSHLLEKFNGNRILAAAAYNAGPHRVNKWLNEQGEKQPVDVWIETIPFKETRQYVQNVLCFSVIYAYRMGKPTNFLSQSEAKEYL